MFEEAAEPDQLILWRHLFGSVEEREREGKRVGITSIDSHSQLPIWDCSAKRGVLLPINQGEKTKKLRSFFIYLTAITHHQNRRAKRACSWKKKVFVTLRYNNVDTKRRFLVRFFSFFTKLAVCLFFGSRSGLDANPSPGYPSTCF